MSNIYKHKYHKKNPNNINGVNEAQILHINGPLRWFMDRKK